jgi:hypothetical protein
MATGLVGATPFFAHLLFAIRASVGLIRQRDASPTRTLVALLFIRDAIGAAGSGGLWGVSGFWITSFMVIAMWYGRGKTAPPKMVARQVPRLAIHARGGAWRL